MGVEKTEEEKEEKEGAENVEVREKEEVEVETFANGSAGVIDMLEVWHSLAERIAR